MRRTRRALCCAAMLGLTVQATATDKNDTLVDMLALADQIDTVRDRTDNTALLHGLFSQYRALSDSLGGDDPANLLVSGGHAVNGGALAPPAAPAGTTATTTSASNNTPAAINDMTTTTSMVNVAAADSYIWDVDLTTGITHTFSGDLTITLTSPAGTAVTASSENGSFTDNTYDGSLFDDQSLAPVTDFLFVDNVTAGPVTPEGAFCAFNGEDPNGTWTLDVFDGLNGDTGTLNDWTIDVTTLDLTPDEVCVDGANNTPGAIDDNQTTTRTIDIAGADDFTCDVDVTVDITHTFAGDLEIAIESPAGTIVTLSTDNGSSSDDVFVGTVFDDSASTPATDFLYVDNTPTGPLQPEGALSAFNGEDPNGTWTLTVFDDAGADQGTLNSWALKVATCSAPAECFLVLGDGPGNGNFQGGDHLFQTQVDGVDASFPVALIDYPELVIPSGPPLPGAVGMGGSLAGIGLRARYHWTMSAQVLMWNPHVFPGMPEQYSAGMQLKVTTLGELRTFTYGSNHGEIFLEPEIRTNAQGQLVLAFPFSIGGF